jgi:hypothetical protein
MEAGQQARNDISAIQGMSKLTEIVKPLMLVYTAWSDEVHWYVWEWKEKKEIQDFGSARVTSHNIKIKPPERQAKLNWLLLPLESEPSCDSLMISAIHSRALE